MAKTPFPLYSWRFWSAYLIHMRPYLLFVSGAAGLAGIAASPSDPIPKSLFWMGFVPLFLGYGFGQALTDCTQVDTDRLSAPYRPLSQGIVTPTSIGAVSLLGLVLGVGLLVWLNPWNAITGTLAILGLATYTFFKRRFWFAGPPYNAWIVSLLPFLGYSAMAGAGFFENFQAVFPIMALSFWAYMNFVLMGYLKDISADRATGYRTFPVVFGWNPTVWVGDLLVLLSMFFAAALSFANPWSKLVWGLATLIAVSGQVYAHITSEKTEANAAGSIAATVRSFILWHLAVILAFREEWWPGLVVFYLLFELVLWKRPAQTQV